MDYVFKRMTQKEAEEIAYHWHYDGPYSFYDMEADPEDMEEFLDPVRRGETTYSVYDRDKLVGFFSFTSHGEHVVEMGLGMHPLLTGQGRGLAFIQSGLAFVKERLCSNTIRLAVATFNKRAIKVYKRAGFISIETYLQETNGDRYEFVRMTYQGDQG
ncbi:N-acetyltransferase [Pullulanibacillus camelliae]|uniref:N-acetyltransferase n=1 Tax=Pullulanibacillus camelliae TaxID=1707096 RepID=A0A8J2YI09_9BACL|nr:GNAT family N-acetyltransferase [Pullulanibacillus camelliae]GGE44013.1 N-acetyltransferase [Pullulanibacillus camelliae]